MPPPLTAHPPKKPRDHVYTRCPSAEKKLPKSQKLMFTEKWKSVFPSKGKWRDDGILRIGIASGPKTYRTPLEGQISKHVTNKLRF